MDQVKMAAPFAITFDFDHILWRTVKLRFGKHARQCFGGGTIEQHNDVNVVG